MHLAINLIWRVFTGFFPNFCRIFADLTFPRFYFPFSCFPCFFWILLRAPLKQLLKNTEQKPNRREENQNRTKTEHFPAQAIYNKPCHQGEHQGIRNPKLLVLQDSGANVRYLRQLPRHLGQS